ncbi:MAG: homocitrate synthase/isopropylmalate synthase family protein, partial [Spirochaetota bacterium]
DQQAVLTRRPTIIDSTLRDGEQAPGVVFAPNERRQIAELLATVGVDEIEAGTPAMGGEELEFLKWCTQLGVPCRTWCRATESDIAAARETGLAHVHVGLPVSEIQLSAFGFTREWVRRRVPDCMRFCGDSFESVSLGLMDASRADPEFVLEVVHAAADLGYCRVRLADTTGVLTPSGVVNFLRWFAGVSVPIEFHAHNDLGMATANAVTALENGARAISATALGIGERAGNARLEEVALVLALSWGAIAGLNLAAVKELARVVAGAAGRAIAPDKPIVGDLVFTHETGIHVAGALRDPLSFLPIEPQSFGLGSPSIRIGRHSGSRSIQHALSTRAVEIDRQTASELVPHVRRRSEALGRNLESTEVEAIYYEFIDARAADRTG